MEFYVNGEQLDIVLENEKTVGDVLKSFETECAKNYATTIHIVLNGKNIGAQEFESISEEPLSDNTKLELTIISKDEIIASFNSQKEDCESLSKELEALPVKLQGGKDKEASLIITKLADIIENFCHTATLSSLFPEVYSKLLIDGKNVNDFFQEFSGILNDFQEAFSSSDTVLMGDLAEYEISPRLLLIANTIKEL